MILYQELKFEVPNYFARTEGMQTVLNLKELIHLQATTQVNRWYLIPKHLQNRVLHWHKYFDVGGSFSTSYVQLVMGSNCTSVKLALAEPNFDEPSWPERSKGQVASLVMVFLDGKRVIGARIALIHRDGRLESVHDYGLVDDNNDANGPAELILPNVLAKYVRGAADLTA